MKKILVAFNIEGSTDTHCGDCYLFDAEAADPENHCPWHGMLKYNNDGHDCERPKECLEAEAIAKKLAEG